MNPKPFQALIKLLQQEQVIYEEMAQLLDVEREALLGMAADQVGQVVSRKETLALRIKTLDESRKMLARRLGAVCGLKSDQVTVSELARFAPGTLGSQLLQTAQSLREVVEYCQKVNQYNDKAARKAVDLVGGALEYMIEQADPTGQVYKPGKGGRGYAPNVTKGSGGGPGFISRTA